MPTYDYSCKKCKTVKEAFHGLSEIPKIKCDKCGSPCEKIFSATMNVIFKGSGWNDKERRMKTQMTKKNNRMKDKMTDREVAGDAVRNMGELKKKTNQN